MKFYGAFSLTKHFDLPVNLKPLKKGPNKLPFNAIQNNIYPAPPKIKRNLKTKKSEKDKR